jgi:serine/threonine protein kinase/Flp pilus assembly protein TadD
MIQQVLGHYRILEKIGEGGMGVMYRAHDDRLDRDVAVKVLRAGTLANEKERARVREEALVLSKLNHPNIETVHDFDTQDATDFLVTEYIPGVTLGEILAQGPLPEREILHLAAQLAEGMAAAHELGLVHRDLKPGNLRVTPDGRLKILDLGLARPLPQPVSETTVSEPAEEISGTLLFMSPEQILGEPADARSDIYSAGVLFYQMATGRHPFTEKTAIALADAVLRKDPQPPTQYRPELPVGLEEIILRCLEKKPAHRFATARDLLADLRSPDAAARAEKSLAVLCFENLGGHQEDEYFCDGITEDITTELAKIRELRVLSRSAVLPFRDKPTTPLLAGKQLRTTHVLEGGVRRQGDRLRVTATLVETRSGRSVWAERYDRKIEDVFAIQDQIARNIAGALRLVLTEEEKRAIEKIPTADVRAYDFYLRGRKFFHEFRRKGLDFAREMFTRAIEIDPRYARAYSGIADCSAFLYMYWESTLENPEKADAASRKALELDPDLAEAHASRGLTASLQKRYADAQKEFEIALELNPKLFEPCYFLARNFYSQGKLAEAVEWFERASHVNPEDYQSPMLMASALHGSHRTAEALAAYHRGLDAIQKHLEVHPGDARALYFGANALTQVGDRKRSLEWAGRALDLEPEESQVLYNVACVYALLGERDRAIDCLEKSLTHGWAQRQWMEHDPDLASLQGHPRFEALRARPQ